MNRKMRAAANNAAAKQRKRSKERRRADTCEDCGGEKTVSSGVFAIVPVEIVPPKKDMH